MRPLLSPPLGKLDTWPSYPASEANVVFVSPDWSDLDSMITYLEENQDIAKGIARRQRDIIEKYLSPAAEVCYWRKLITGWSEVARPTEEWDKFEGMRWETFSLMGKFKWE
jgi:hypothetical protein